MATFEKIAKRLMVKEPFYGLFLLSLNKQESEEIPTLGVALQGINHMLLINPKYWESLTDDQQIAVLKHELMHICFKHTTSLYKDLPVHKIANIAMDCEINQNILNLPPGVVRYEELKAQPDWHDLEAKAGSRYYYKYFMTKAKKQPQFNNGDGDPNFGTGGGDPGKMGSHEKWKDFGELSEPEKELVEQQVDFVVKNTAEQVQKMRGVIPGELQSYIDKLMAPKPEVFNWKAYFRRLLGTSEEFYKKSSRKKPSKRFDDAPGFRHIHKQKLLVAVDTSGSVSNSELQDFFSEINYIYKAGASIDILEYDARVNNVWSYAGKAPDKVSGRGGTVWQAAYDWYLPRAKDYSAFVTFTDGYDYYRPTHPIRNAIFVVTSNGDHNNTYPGKAVFIPANNGKNE